MGRRKKKRRWSKEARRREQRRREREAHPPRMGHETMLLVAPPFRTATEAIIRRLQRPPGEPPELMREEHLMLPEVEGARRCQAVSLVSYRCS